MMSRFVPMARRVAWKGPALVALLLAVPSEAPAQWITPYWGDTYSFRAQGDQAVLRIPMTLDRDTAATLEGFQLVAVRAGSVHDEALFEAIVPSLGEGPVPAAVLTLDLTILSRPDTVDLLLRALRTGGEPHDMNLHLVRPAAAVRDPGTIRVERVAGSPAGDRTPPLVIVETTSRSELRGLRLRSLPFTSDGERQAEVEVTSGFPADSAVAPSGHDRMPYALTGSIPLGTSTGTVLLTSPQLPAPVPVTFEIRKRLSLWILALVILLGLGIGFIVRVWLEQRKELAQARNQARDVLTRLRKAREAYADAAFHATVDDQIRILQDALAADPASDLIEKTTASQDALAGAIEALRGRLKTEEDRRETMGTLAGTPWLLPTSMDEVLAGVRERLSAVKAALEKGDAAEAEALLDANERELARELRTALEAWRPRLSDAWASIRTGRARLPKQVREQAEGSLEALATSLDAIPVPAAGAGAPDEIRPTLEGVDTHRQTARETLLRLLLGIRAVEAEVREILEPLSDPEAWVRVTEALEALERAVAPEVELEAGLDAFTAAAPWEAWAIGIRAQASTTPDGLDDALDEGDYHRAATLIAGARREAPSDLPLGDTGDTGAAPAPRTHARTLGMGLEALGRFLSPRGATPPGTATLPAVGTPEALAALTARSKREIYIANAIQFVVSALLLTIIGMTILADDFVGTLPELVAAFFWGFTLDIAVGTVTEQVGKLPGGS